LRRGYFATASAGCCCCFDFDFDFAIVDEKERRETRDEDESWVDAMDRHGTEAAGDPVGWANHLL